MMFFFFTKNKEYTDHSKSKIIKARNLAKSRNFINAKINPHKVSSSDFCKYIVRPLYLENVESSV